MNPAQLSALLRYWLEQANETLREAPLLPEIDPAQPDTGNLAALHGEEDPSGILPPDVSLEDYHTWLEEKYKW